jgi:hypothetical protein
MNRQAQRKAKIVVAAATAHLLFWFWALSWIAKKAASGSPVVIGAMIALMLAAWIQYRTALALRRLNRKEASDAR